MSKDAPLDQIRKANEDDYFRKLNSELSRKLAARAQMKEVGVADEKLAEQLADLGFDQDSARALFLVPLLQVAWADHEVQTEERHQIFEVLKQRKIEEGSGAFKLVSNWLKKGPEDALFARAVALIEPLIAETRKSSPDQAGWILESARQVAQATGGLFGLGIGTKISSAEEKILQGLAKSLKS